MAQVPERVKVVVTVPLTHAESVRTAIGEAGGGTQGPYIWCSFTVAGTGRFRPGDQAHPHVGVPGQGTSVLEERIEVTVERDDISRVVTAIRAAHPYEEPVIDIYPLLDIL